MKVKKDAPAISMEEATPTTVSEERTLAPHEVYDAGKERKVQLARI